VTKDWTRPDRPYSIAHRGASAYAYDNTLRAFDLAAELGADMWEVDIRMTRDGVPVAHHDADLPDGTPVTALDWATLAERTVALGRPAPRLDEVVALAARRGVGVYADIKDNGAALPTLDLLRQHGIERAILGAFDPEVARALQDAGSPYPRAVLVPLGADPFEHARGADVIHLCWERMDRPQDTLIPALFERAFAQGQRVVLWHEEDAVRMAAIRVTPVTGICSDRPEMVNPFTPPPDWPVEIVCHRGANLVAPENTLPAIDCAFHAGFSHVEVDLQDTADGEIVVLHDRTLDRTTNGHGPANAQPLAALRALDAGKWFDPFFAGTRIPTLDEVLASAQAHGGALFLELKQADPDRVWAGVTAAGLADRVFFWSFDAARIQRMRQIAPGARLMARRQDYPDLAATLASYAPQIVEYTPGEDMAEFPVLRAKGIQPMVAYMGGDPAVFDAIIAARPDLVNLDQPFAFARHLTAGAARK
jgi:glycerophosphoryl diester phosphodiesterase